ncbi:NUDIX domain-containing protein [Streptomyces sp. H10-C2]|uniref:NUDIX hydrolase n=1 Tax=unclassified Streptomyces TaxID=2593676 RepID=UPI001105AFEE|nr:MULTISPECIES: NUDIX domain-containing protein [unclassified Streptomyces]MDJ0344936.1 NUDIX domain-containing protein [Streptomyces sp. PH10-H1]MDJ0373806.1 NUDIX domain-containing protein [Streptomyces sp. H10-C2]QNA72057.1 NUDIX domain-containing protein [Streptomyces sp. So13.3]
MHPHQNIVGVHLLFENDGQVLLGKRLNTSYAQGVYHVPAGHLEPGEPVTAGAAREAYEELGVVIDDEFDLELVHVVHQHDGDDGRDRLQLFFRVLAHSGVITTQEPDRCAGWEWHSLHALPEPLVGYTRTALDAIRVGRPFTAMGWDTTLTASKPSGGRP